MARLRHFAICVRDLEKSARFYEEVFGLERVGEETLELGSGVYLSDGVVNLALLKLSGVYGTGGEDSSELVGPHHFGFIVDDVDEVTNIPASEIEPTPDFGLQVDTGYMRAMAKTKKGVTTLLDVDHVVSGDVVARATQLAGGT